MLHEDYLMRTIRALTQAFLNMVGASDTSPAQLRFQVDELLGDHFGTQPELVPTLDLDKLEDQPPEVCGELGRLFAFQAQLCRKLGESAREGIAVKWALASFQRGLTVEVPPEIEDAAFDFLRSESAATHVHPVDARECYLSLFRSAARSGRLENAEDAIFAAAELGAKGEPIDQAIEFFDSLLEPDNAVVAASNMKRDDIRAVLEDLNSLD